MASFQANSAEDTALGEELRAICAAVGPCADDGISRVSAFEDALSRLTGAAEAVVVSSDAAMLTVLLGAWSARRGDAIAHTLADVPEWITGAAALAGVDLLAASDFRPEDTPALFRIDPPERAQDGAANRVVFAADVAPVHLTESLWQAPVTMVSMTEGQPLSTGEGGALLFRDPEMGARARSFAQFGNLDGKTLGVNHKLSAAQAALGLVRLARVLPKEFPLRAPSKAMKASSVPGSQPVPDRFNPTSPADAEMIARALSRPLAGTSTTVQQYEAALSHWFEAPHAIAVSSGYAAVLTALLALGLAPGDEVLLTPTCPLCTVYALLAIGVRPVFCDTRPDDFGLDLLSAGKALGPRTRAIIDIPMWGYPIRADESAGFARAHGLRYVLDLALAYGVELNGKGIWCNADLAVFSTHGSKVLVTGEGGFVLSASEDLAEQVRYARGGTGRLGTNFSLSGLQAALGLARLPMLHRHILERRANMDAIATGLAHPDIEPLQVCNGGVAGGVKLLVRHRHGDGANLNNHLQASGVPSDILTYSCRPLYQFPVLSSAEADCPNATALLSSIATLPVHPDIKPGHIQRMLNALNTLSYRSVA